MLLVLLALLLIFKESSAFYLPGAGSFTKSSKSNIDPEGGYNFDFKTDNGIEREEKGSFENGIWTVRGVVSWIAPDNKIYGYEYTADDKGYQQVDMIPEDGDTRVDPRTAEGLLG